MNRMHLISTLFLVLVACKKNKEIYPVDATKPIVETIEVSYLGGMAYKYRGNIIDDGGLPILSRGIITCVCPREIITSSFYLKTNDGKGTGMFENNVNGLTKNVDYYWRVYATNALGTSYGKVVFSPSF
jgi:hypothetical protein